MPAHVWLQCAWAQLMGRWAGSEGCCFSRLPVYVLGLGGSFFHFGAKILCIKNSQKQNL